MGLTSKERVNRAMRSGYDDACEPPDQVPTFCQLSIGYYFINSGLDPFDIWYRSESFAEALVGMQQRTGFDGILVNLPGRDPDFEDHVDRLERGEREDVVWWKNGNYTRIPHDDNPHYFLGNGDRYFPTFEELDPETLYYVEPWDLTDVTYPYTWGFDEEPRPFDSFFDPFHQDTLKSVIKRVGESASVHAEIFSPFAQFLELLNFQNGLMAMILDPGKVHACLERLTLGATELGQAARRMRSRRFADLRCLLGRGVSYRESTTPSSYCRTSGGSSRRFTPNIPTCQSTRTPAAI